MKEDYQKALKKLTLLFVSNPVPFNGQSYQKQKGPGTSDQSPFRLQNKFKKIALLVIYYLQISQLGSIAYHEISIIIAFKTTLFEEVLLKIL